MHSDGDIRLTCMQPTSIERTPRAWASRTKAMASSLVLKTRLSPAALTLQGHAARCPVTGSRRPLSTTPMARRMWGGSIPFSRSAVVIAGAQPSSARAAKQHASTRSAIAVRTGRNLRDPPTHPGATSLPRGPVRTARPRIMPRLAGCRDAHDNGKQADTRGRQANRFASSTAAGWTCGHHSETGGAMRFPYRRHGIGPADGSSGQQPRAMEIDPTQFA